MLSPSAANAPALVKPAVLTIREVVYGSFQRTIPLAPGVDKDRITADLHNGVLEINAPIAAASLPRKIEVKSTSAAKQVSA